MNNQYFTTREQLENWLAAFQCGPTTQHKAMAEIEGVLQSPAPEAGQLTTDNLWAASKLCGVALMPAAQHRAIVAGLAGKVPEGFVLLPKSCPSWLEDVYDETVRGLDHPGLFLPGYDAMVEALSKEPLPPSPKEGGL